MYADPGVTGRFDVTHYKSMADLKLKKDGKVIWKKDPNREYNSYQYEILVKIISDLDNLLEPGGKFAKIYAKKATEEAKKAAKEGVKAATDAVKTAATAAKDKAEDAMKSVRNMKGFRLLRPEDKNVAGYTGNLAEDTAEPIKNKARKIIRRKIEEPAISLIDDAPDVVQEGFGSVSRAS